MAQMHPRNGPALATPSAAENRMYEILHTRLSNEYHVFHNVERYGKSKNGRLLKGEIDFLILHPDYGMIMLEVKGGRLEYDKDTRKWTTIDRTDHAHQLPQSPFQQVSNTLRDLKSFLQKAPETKDFRYEIIPSIMFFSVTWEPKSLVEFPDELILDNRALDAPQAAIEKLFAYGNVHPVPGKIAPEAIDALMSRFDPTFIAPNLADEIVIDNRIIDFLTEAQCDRLNAMRRVCHLAIPGAAGTGKTILAFEAARMYARAQRRTMLICVNEFQAQWLQERADTECDINEHFDIYDIKTLCNAFAQQAGITTKEIDAAQIVSTNGQTRMAQGLQKCIDRLRSRQSATSENWQYQAIVIDEGQDIEKPLLLTIGKLLRDPQKGAFYLFYDPEQRLDFTEEWRLPFNDIQTMTSLHDNLRNTKFIYEAMIEFHPVMGFFAFNGPEGRPIEYLPIAIEGHANDDEAIKATLFTIIERLVKTDGILPKDIMVVTCRTNEQSRWKQWQTLGDLRLRALTQLRQMKPEERDQFVRISTIRASKGLESDIVILVEHDGVDNDPRREKLLYVAISRAKHHLIVLGTPEDVASRRPPDPNCGDC